MNKTKYALGAAVILLAGCVNLQEGKDFDSNKASTFQKGRSSKADVIAALGDPANTGGNSDGSYIEYRYSHVTGMGNPLAALGIGSSKVDDKEKQCRFNFDHSDKLRDYTCQEGTPDYSGFGKQ